MPKRPFTITITGQVELDPASFPGLLIQNGPRVGVWDESTPTAEQQLAAEIAALDVLFESGPARQLEQLLDSHAKPAAMHTFAEALRELFPGTAIQVAPLRVTEEGP